VWTMWRREGDTRRESGFDGDFSGGCCGRGLSSRRIRSFLLVVSGRTGGYDDLGERVRGVFMGGRDLEPSREQKFDLSDDSISAFRFL